MTHQWIVSGNLGRFRIDQVLNTEKDIVEYFKTMLLEGNDVGDNTVILTDAQIFKIFESQSEQAAAESDSADGEVLILTALEEAEARASNA